MSTVNLATRYRQQKRPKETRKKKPLFDAHTSSWLSVAGTCCCGLVALNPCVEFGHVVLEEQK
jgi:hypothetical protein